MNNETASNGCQIHRLAEGDIGAVTLCPDCGVVHVAIQNVILRLKAEDFHALVQLIDAARMNINRLVQESLLASAPSSTDEAVAMLEAKLH